MIDILSHKKSFEIFIKHLIAEFCIECLLSLVEMIQYQQFIYYNYFRNDKWNKNYRLNDMDYFQESLFKKINFPESVPKSKIVYDNQENIHSATKSISTKINSYSQSKNFNLNLPSSHHGHGHHHHARSSSKSKSLLRSGNTMFNEVNVLKEDEEQQNSLSSNDQSFDSKYDKKQKETLKIKNILKKQARKIYDKYIAVGSQYEVNIAWTIRNRIIKLFNGDHYHQNEKRRRSNNNVKMDLNEFEFNDYIELYDCVCNEMYKLMKDSFDRFRRKNEYQKLKKMIFNAQ